MSRFATATLLLSLTLLIGCQPKPDVEEENPAPTVITPEPAAAPATTDEESAAEPAAPEGSSTSTAAPATESTPEAETAPEAVVEEEVVVEEEEAAPTEKEFMQQIGAAMQSRDMDTALKVAEQAQAAFPDSERWLSLRAGLLMQAGRVEEGMVLLKEAYQKTPENGQLASQIIQMGLRTADQAEGEAKYKATTDVVAFLDEIEKAGRLETLGQYKDQIVAFVRFSDAESQVAQGNLDAAKQALQAAFDSGFRDVEALRDDEAFAELLQQEDVAKIVIAREEELRLEYLADARAELDKGETFPFDFSLEDITGKTVALQDYAGKVLIVDFWGTWCPPCRKEVPHFIKLEESFGDDLAIVGINYEHGENDEANVKLIKEFSESMGLDYPCCLGDEETQQQVPDLQGFPTTLFIDRSGKVRMTTVGYRPYGVLNAIVSVLAEEKPAESTGDTATEELAPETPVAEEPAPETPAAEEPAPETPAAEEPAPETPAESIDG